MPYGYLLCNGAAVSRTTYAKLFNVIGTAYGSGDGSTTFNLPNIEGRFVEGGTVGEYKSAGLPNIEGSFGFWVENNAGLWARISDGAFYTAGDWGYRVLNTPLDGEAPNPGWIGMNASLSNSIYGNSNTVQPNSVCAKYCIRYI